MTSARRLELELKIQEAQATNHKSWAKLEADRQAYQNRVRAEERENIMRQQAMNGALSIGDPARAQEIFDFLMGRKTEDVVEAMAQSAEAQKGERFDPVILEHHYEDGSYDFDTEHQRNIEPEGEDA